MKHRGQLKTILFLTAYRTACAMLTRNYEYPDQYWQGPEVAHHMHYSYGWLTWQWTMQQPIRNPVYPFILSLSYYILDLLNLTTFHAYAPQFVIQVPLAIITDYYLIKILKNIYGEISVFMMIAVFGNWYYACTMVRTYFNSFETMAAIIGVYYWFKSGIIGITNSDDIFCRIIAIISYVSRPTSIMIWAILWPYQLIRIASISAPFSRKSFLFIVKNILTIIVMIMSSLIVGSMYYGRVTLTQVNFIKYNFVEKWSQLYGQEPPYYYFIISVPFIVNTALLCVGLVLIRSFQPQTLKNSHKYSRSQQNNPKHQNNKIKILTILCVLYLLISSLSVHKQHRFIFPIIPFILIISAQCLQQHYDEYQVIGIKVSTKIIKSILYFTVLLNVCLVWQFNVYGKSDGHSAWEYISDKIDEQQMGVNQTSVIVMGQSHFIPPAFSSIHKNIKYRIPDSSAPKMSKNISEVKLLTQNPEQLFRLLTDDGQFLPTFVIAQGRYLQHIAHVLGQRRYAQVMHWRHCTVFQEIFFGYDSISIFERKPKLSGNKIIE